MSCDISGRIGPILPVVNGFPGGGVSGVRKRLGGWHWQLWSISSNWSPADRAAIRRSGEHCEIHRQHIAHGDARCFDAADGNVAWSREYRSVVLRRYSGKYAIDY